MSSVLVVEDDGLIRRSIAEFLKAEGYDVESAPNGKVALDKLKKGSPPELILLDVMMPVMNAFEFRAEQWKDRALAHVPVIVLTGDGTPSEKAAKLGAIAFLQKPFPPVQLLNLVSDFFRQRP